MTMSIIVCCLVATLPLAMWPLNGEVCGGQVVDVVAMPGIGCAMEEVVVVVVVASCG